jgi:hypothetical protein
LKETRIQHVNVEGTFCGVAPPLSHTSPWCRAYLRIETGFPLPQKMCENCYSIHSPAVVPRPSSLEPIRKRNCRQNSLAYAGSYFPALGGTDCWDALYVVRTSRCSAATLRTPNGSAAVILSLPSYPDTPILICVCLREGTRGRDYCESHKPFFGVQLSQACFLAHFPTASTELRF